MRAAALALLLAGAALAETALPSGLEVTRHDALVETQPGGETWLVLRYLAPAIAGGAVGYDSVAPELDLLCATEGLAEAAAAGEAVDQVLIVLMDRPVSRGVPDPEATQYLGAYRIDGGACRWE
jgi:hypothetical protein